jgi:hypothetical protein
MKEDILLDYIFTVSPHVDRHYGEEILAYPCIAIFSSTLRVGNGSYRLKWSPDVPRFTGNPTKMMWQGHTVTYAAMQVAYYMGLKEVYTIGLDHSFSYPRDKFDRLKKALIASKGDDINHFFPEYFDTGDEHARAEPHVTQGAYLLARKAYEADGRILANASAHTMLDEKYLPRVDFDSLFEEE